MDPTPIKRLMSNFKTRDVFKRVLRKKLIVFIESSGKKTEIVLKASGQK